MRYLPMTPHDITSYEGRVHHNVTESVCQYVSTRQLHVSGYVRRPHRLGGEPTDKDFNRVQLRGASVRGSIN